MPNYRPIFTANPYLNVVVSSNNAGDDLSLGGNGISTGNLTKIASTTLESGILIERITIIADCSDVTNTASGTTDRIFLLTDITNSGKAIIFYEELITQPTIDLTTSLWKTTIIIDEGFYLPQGDGDTNSLWFGSSSGVIYAITVEGLKFD